jgi:magnesium-transporting ATPase (P-type)
MRSLAQPKYLYFLIPLSVYWVTSIAMIIYIFIRRDLKKGVKIGLLIFMMTIICFVLVPIYLDVLFKINLENSKYYWIYFYVISVPSSIYVIKDLQKYMEEKSID